MKASELRIGNILWWDYIADNAAVTSIDTLQVSLDRSERSMIDIDDLNPIPITEEWLLKFGFKDDEPHNYINVDEHGAMQIMFDQYRKVVSIFTAGAHYYMKEIQYVHQLQNLYFALTGEELTIIKNT